MTELPAPLTPPDCDLRGLEFMPLYCGRLVDSDLFALSTGAEFKAAVALWCKSWFQVPAASLPDDDRILAHLSGAGAQWKKVKQMALRGWVKCSDGRWYHPVVAEQAMEALPRRQEYQEKKSGDAERKERERQDRKQMFDYLKSINVVPDWNIKTSDLRRLASQHDYKQVTPPVTDKDCDKSQPVTNDVTAKTGTGTGTGTGIGTGILKPVCADGTPENPKSEAHTPQQSLGKFPMHLEWKPDHEILSAACMRAGCLPSIVTTESLADFTGYWAHESAVFTEGQWVQKLIPSAKKFAYKNHGDPDGNSQRFAGKNNLNLDDTSWGDNLDAALDIG